MPSDPEILKLKKEIHHLKEHNAELSQANKELNDHVGELQKELFNFKNKSLFIKEAQLAQSKESLRLNIEEAVIEEKEKLEKVQKENELLKNEINLYKRRIYENELQIQKMQIENNELKKQLIDFGKKHEATHFISEIQKREDSIAKKEKEYQKIVLEWNELRDQMEAVLSENRVLRQIADVPENFGIDIQQIKMGDRIKIEDYKGKIRELKKQIDDLETERAQLKHRLIYLASTMQISEQPFSDLTPEQKILVAEYAQRLSEGKEPIPKERYDLLKEIERLKTEIQILRDQGRGKVDNNYLFGYEGKGWENHPLSKEIKTLREENAELKGMLTETLNKMTNQGDAFNSHMENFKMGQTYRIPENGQYEEFSLRQLPPIPFYNEKNVDDTKFGGSYRFNTKYKIDIGSLYKLFGVAVDEADPDALKRESAALQTQVIELLEIEYRRNENDQVLNNNLKKIYGKFETHILIQNEIFERYMKEKKDSKDKEEKSKRELGNLRAELENVIKINQSYQTTIDDIMRKNRTDLEVKIIERIKENAILETNLSKLKRKYECLAEDEKKLREFVEESEKSNIEKDRILKETIAKLKKWKSLLIFYLKKLNEKLKKTVERSEFDKIIGENKYLRLKNNELYLKDLNVTKQLSTIQTLKMQYKDLENDYYKSEEMKLDAQIELSYLKNRMQEIDPEYSAEQRAFRKFSLRIAELKMTYDELLSNFIEDTNSNRNNSNKGSSLIGLTLSNSLISKDMFEKGLEKLKITNAHLSSADKLLIYRTLNCERDEDKVDLRLLIKKLDQTSMSDIKESEKDVELLEKFINCVRSSGQSLLTTFEYFDTNNNGFINREEFKFALQQLKFNLSDESIDKLVLLVRGNKRDSKLDHTDSFNYIEFCDLFEQKAKNYILSKKKMNLNKNTMKIDWRFNILSAIVMGMKSTNTNTSVAFLSLDRTMQGYLTLEEFNLFVHSVGAAVSKDEILKLYKSYETKNSKLISILALTSDLEKTESQLEAYNRLTGKIMSNEESTIDLHKKYYLLKEEKEYWQQKQDQLNKRIYVLQIDNDDLNKQVESYVQKNQDLMEKYYKVIDEKQKMDETYVNGVTREQLTSVEDTNESLVREVTILRVGLNTFKELYNSSNRQVKELSMNSARNLDELDTYKKAVKELQSETSQNALIGKLYYTILISRWREANTLKKYDDFVGELSAMKEENFQLTTLNQNLTKDLTEVQINLQETMVENIRMSDQIENYENGIVVFNSKRDQLHPFDEMKKLVHLLSEDKAQSTENIIKLKKKVLHLENEKDALLSQSIYVQRLKEEIAFNNQDEYSKKLIGMCDEISTLRLGNNKLKRENAYLQESETHLQKLNDQVNKGIKELEEQNAEWESKYRKMEEVYRSKDAERQKKVIEALKKMKLYDTKEIQFIMTNESPEILIEKTKEKAKNPQDIKKIEELEEQIKELNNVIILKNQKIEQLSKINSDNVRLLQQGKQYINNANIPSLVGQSGYDMIKDDETKLIAQTAHKTIKTLQDLLSQKNNVILKKDEQIERLYDENKKMKEEYVRRLAAYEDISRKDHDSTMRKLANIIDITNKNIVVKITSNDLSQMTMDEIEKMLTDKDHTIKALGIELNEAKNESEANYQQLIIKNRKIGELEQQIKEMEFNNKMRYQSGELENMKKVYEEKIEMINREKEKIDKLKSEFAQKYQQREDLDEKILERTANVPERLIINKEKSSLYTTIVRLEKDKTKLKNEKKKLLEEIEAMKKEKEDIVAKVDKWREDKNNMLQQQIRDTKNISVLRKEKEKLKASNDQLKEELKLLKKQYEELKNQQVPKIAKKSQNTQTSKKQSKSGNISQLINESMKSNSQEEQPKKYNMHQSSNLIDREEDEKEEKEKKKSEDMFKSIYDTVNRFDKKKKVSDVLSRFVNFCVEKRTNMLIQLKRYTKTETIMKENFKNAIEDLKIGFSGEDLEELYEIAKPSGGEVYIQYFLNVMKDKDERYRKFMDEQERLQSRENRTQSKKYDPFENKKYNINY